METISLKMDTALLEGIDSSLQKHKYSTRTEFIRDAIRGKLTQLEKEEAIKKLAAMRGCMKGKAVMSDEEAGETAIRALAKEYKIKLD